MGANNPYALSFDGSGDYVDLGVQSVGGVDLFATAGQSWTVEFWAKVASGNTGTFIAKAGELTGHSRYFLQVMDLNHRHF